MRLRLTSLIIAAAFLSALAGCSAETGSLQPTQGQIIDSQASEDESGGDAITMPDDETEQESEDDTMYFNVIIDGSSYRIIAQNNPATEALMERLETGDITVSLSDYGGFEKTGPLGFSLPSDNVSMTTKAGDIVLYNGNHIVMFYGANSWSYTLLGRAEDAGSFVSALGSGGVDVILSK